MFENNVVQNIRRKMEGDVIYERRKTGEPSPKVINGSERKKVRKWQQKSKGNQETRGKVVKERRRNQFTSWTCLLRSLHHDLHFAKLRSAGEKNKIALPENQSIFWRPFLPSWVVVGVFSFPPFSWRLSNYSFYLVLSLWRCHSFAFWPYTTYTFM